MGASDLERGRAAYAERRWPLCVEALRAADSHDPLPGEDLKLLGIALYMAGDDPGSAEVLERTHRLAVDQARWVEAAETAFWYAFMLVAAGEPARGGAWLARSRAIALEHEVQGSVAALPDVVEARVLVTSGRLEEGMALATAAAGVGRQEGNADLEVLGRLVVGWALLHQGNAEDALACFDEVMLTVSSGDLYPTVAGLAYCAVISACMSVLDVHRAREWTGVLSDWCDSQDDVVPYRGECLVHRSQLKAMDGDWPAAIEEARRACVRVERTSSGDAWYQLGELHRLRGAWAEAEDAYRHANRLGRQPEPGLALMRLAQGRTDAAVTTFKRLHAEPDRLDRLDVLAGFVEAMLASGDLESAVAAAEELASTVETAPLVHRARAHEARGAVRLAQGDPAGALSCLRPAAEIWQSLAMPYDAARTRVRIGEACRALGDDDSASLEHEAAREVFARLGAAPDLARLEGPASTGPLTAREVEVLRLVAAGRTNRHIAGALVLSEKTVARHLSNIYAKLGLGSRAAATAYAYDHHLV